jgi:hypothetical protein
MPPVPLIGSCSGWDCFVDFILFWLGFPESPGNISIPLINKSIPVKGYKDYHIGETPGPSGFLLEIVIPLAAFTLILYGFASQLDIFGYSKWINVVLAFLMVIVSAKIGIFRAIVGLVFSVLPTYTFIIWTVLFVVGVWFIFRKGLIKGQTAISTANIVNDSIADLNREIMELRNRRNRLVRQLARPGITDAEAGSIRTHIQKIDEDIRTLIGQKQELQDM